MNDTEEIKIEGIREISKKELEELEAERINKIKEIKEISIKLHCLYLLSSIEAK